MVPIVLIPNDTSLKSSGRDVSNADLFGTDTVPTIPTIPTVEISNIDHGKSAKGGEIQTVVFGTVIQLLTLRFGHIPYPLSPV